jgi:hypothetical protein
MAQLYIIIIIIIIIIIFYHWWWSFNWPKRVWLWPTKVY